MKCGEKFDGDLRHCTRLHNHPGEHGGPKVRRWRYYLLDPGNVVIQIRKCPEKIGIAWRAEEGVIKYFGVDHRLRIRKASYDYDLGEEIPKGLIWELDMEEALKTGLNIDEWAQK